MKASTRVTFGGSSLEPLSALLPALRAKDESGAPNRRPLLRRHPIGALGARDAIGRLVPNRVPSQVGLRLAVELSC